jgi:ribosomal protein S18 acetylase RimI-like enzyme
MNSQAYSFIFQHDQVYRRHALEWMFKRNIPLIQRRCPSAFRGVLNDKGEVVACFLWTPSPYQNISPWDMMKAGIWQIPYRFGLSTLLRLIKVVEWLRAAEEQSYAAEEDFCMLECMVVRPDYQGQGIGSKCLKSAIAGSETTSRSVRLTTQEERNVRLYQRLGYTVAGEVNFQDAEDATSTYRSWFMVHQPTAEVAKS